MRRTLTSAAVLIAASALLGLPGAAWAEGPGQTNAGPAGEKGANPSAQTGQDNRKTSGTNDQDGPSASGSHTADPNSQGDRAAHSVSGRSGAEEPASHGLSQDAAVFVKGALNVAGAPADSQTVPAKFSERNDKLDNIPIMATSLGLSDEQKRAIAEAVGHANAPAVQTTAGLSQELPWDVAIHDLPDVTTDPRLGEFKYVRTPDRILLVRPGNRIVVGEIAK